MPSELPSARYLSRGRNVITGLHLRGWQARYASDASSFKDLLARFTHDWRCEQRPRASVDESIRDVASEGGLEEAGVLQVQCLFEPVEQALATAQDDRRD